MLLPFPYPLRSKRYNPVSVPTIRLTPIYRKEDKTKVSDRHKKKKGLVTNALPKTKNRLMVESKEPYSLFINSKEICTSVCSSDSFPSDIPVDIDCYTLYDCFDFSSKLLNQQLQQYSATNEENEKNSVLKGDK